MHQKTYMVHSALLIEKIIGNSKQKGKYTLFEGLLLVIL